MPTITTDSIPKLEISRLKGIYINEGRKNEGTYQAEENDPLIHIESDLRSEDNRFIKIRYQRVNSKEWMEYQIKIVAMPSNLGKGKGINHYFLCPVSGRKARVLYYDLKSNYFVRREAYSQKIYYPMETYGKVQRVMENINFHEEKLLKCFLELKNMTYNGRLPSTLLKIRRLQERKQLLEFLQINYLSKNYKTKRKTN